MTYQAPLSPLQPPSPPRTSRLAVWSLILGCFFFIPPLGIVALILGIIAIAKTSSPEGALTGKGYAVAGTILGSLSIIVMCALTPFLMFLGLRSQVQATFESPECKANLKTIGGAILDYQKANNGQMPRTLQTLVGDNYLPDPYILVCPAVGFDSQLDRANVDVTGDYAYARVKDPQGLKSPVPIMWDKTYIHGPAKVNVLFSDGGARFMDAGKLRTMLSDAAAFYESPPKLPQPANAESKRLR